MSNTFDPEELAILAAIHADPRDDTPRLVYADWLQEHDEPDCAEFIRLLCSEPELRLEMRGGPMLSHDCWWLERDIPDVCQRAIELLTKLHGTPRYPETILFDQYVRGMPLYQDKLYDDHLRFTGGYLEQPVTPLLRLDLSLQTRHLADWLEHPLMTRVDRLQISPEFPIDTELDQDSTLNSRYDAYWEEHIPLLAASPIIDRLAELNLCGCHSTGTLTARSRKNMAQCKELLEPRVCIEYGW